MSRIQVVYCDDGADEFIAAVKLGILVKDEYTRVLIRLDGEEHARWYPKPELEQLDNTTEIMDNPDDDEERAAEFHSKLDATIPLTFLTDVEELNEV